MYKLLFKSCLDFVLALVSLVILSPFLIVGILLSLYSFRCNPLFTHQRPGYLEKPIRVIKIRTMSPEYDSKGQKLSNLERVNQVGHFLRRTSIDELPQLINVLKGELAIVGPRPLQMSYLSLYTDSQKKRHLVKPGITGLAQISGRNKLTWEQKFDLDLRYVETLSFALDIKILAKTVIKVFSLSDVNAGGSNTMDAFTGSPTKDTHSQCSSEQKSANL